MSSVIDFAREELNKYLKILGVSADITLGLFDTLGVCLEVADPYYDDAIIISVKDGKGYIAGSNERSVLIGVYRLLSEWGISFIRPGKDGTRYPTLAEARDVDIKESAKNRHRTVCIEGACSIENVLDMIDWLPKVGFNGYYIQFSVPFEFFDRWHTHKKNPYKTPVQITEEQVNEYTDIMVREIKRRGLLLERMGHGWTCTPFGISDRGWYKVDEEALPESYRRIIAKVDGERKLTRGVPVYSQLCYSDPYVKNTIVKAVVDYAKEHREVDIVHFWLGDMFNNTCECENCTKTVYSDYYAAMINEITEQLVREGLKTKIVICIGYNTSHPPVTQQIKNQDNTILMFAPITRSYAEVLPSEFTKTEIPEYKVNKFELVFGKTSDIADNLAYLYAWEKNYHGDAVDFDYHLMWDHILDAGGEGIARVAYEDIHSFKSLGINGLISCQLQRNTFPTSIAMTTMARTLWNTDTSFDTIRRELYSASFGEEMTDVMCDYFSTLSRAFDVGAIRNLKEFDPTEFKKNMETAILAMDSFGEVIERGMQSHDPCIKRSFEVLYHHRIAYTLVGKSTLAFLEGNTEEGNALRQEAIDYILKNEDTVQDVVDSMYFARMISERITITGTAKFTVI